MTTAHDATSTLSDRVAFTTHLLSRTRVIRVLGGEDQSYELPHEGVDAGAAP